jgi:hypothetical protein
MCCNTPLSCMGWGFIYAFLLRLSSWSQVEFSDDFDFLSQFLMSSSAAEPLFIYLCRGKQYSVMGCEGAVGQ